MNDDRMWPVYRGGFQFHRARLTPELALSFRGPVQVQFVITLFLQGTCLDTALAALGKLALFRTLVPSGGSALPAGAGQIGFVSHDRSRLRFGLALPSPAGPCPSGNWLRFALLRPGGPRTAAALALSRPSARIGFVWRDTGPAFLSARQIGFVSHVWSRPWRHGRPCRPWPIAVRAGIGFVWRWSPRAGSACGLGGQGLFRPRRGKLGSFDAMSPSDASALQSLHILFSWQAFSCSQFCDVCITKFQGGRHDLLALVR